jgi:hypothetical protein
MARTRSFKFPNSLTEFETPLDKVQRRMCNIVFNTAGLAIKTGGSAIVKTVNTIKAVIDGVLVSKAAADCAALVGTVTNAKFNVFVFTVNAAGTLITYMGTEAATRAGVVWPTITDGEAVVGFIEVNPTGTGNFVGGTTALDDGTVIPGVVYVNTPFPFIPGLETL